MATRAWHGDVGVGEKATCGRQRLGGADEAYVFIKNGSNYRRISTIQAGGEYKLPAIFNWRLWKHWRENGEKISTQSITRFAPSQGVARKLSAGGGYRIRKCAVRPCVPRAVESAIISSALITANEGNFYVINFCSVRVRTRYRPRNASYIACNERNM